MEIKQYINFRESALQSVVGDASSIALSVGLLLLNRFYLGDKWYVAVFALLLFFVVVYAKTLKTHHVFTDLQEMKDYVASLTE